MTFEEKMTWVSAFVTPLVALAYLTTVLSRLADTSAAEVAYQAPLLVAVGVTVLLMIGGAITIAVATTARAEITGVGSVDDIDRRDERDADINRRGDQVGLYVGSAAAVAALALTMLEADYVWIATALYLGFVVASLANDGVRIAAYRRGF